MAEGGNKYPYRSFNQPTKKYYPGEKAESGHITALRGFRSESDDPTIFNDGADSAGVGAVFSVFDLWLNGTTGALYMCISASTGAASWKQVYAGTGSVWGP